MDIKYLMKGNHIEFQYHGITRSFRVEEIRSMKDEKAISDDFSEIELYPISRDTSVVIVRVFSLGKLN